MPAEPVAAASGSRSSPFDLLAPGVYAWGVTVAWPASQRLSPPAARVFALIALVALVTGAGLAFAAPKAARALGIWAFLAACFVSWSKIPPPLFFARLDPLQGLLGAVGWMVFGWSWARQGRKAPPTQAETNPSLVPRQPMPLRLRIMLLLICSAAAVPMCLAWWVKGFERALVAQAVSLAAAVALVTSAADLVDAGARTGPPLESPPPMQRLARAAPLLTTLGVALAVGAAWEFLR
jgi:hypothetical protein